VFGTIELNSSSEQADMNRSMLTGTVLGVVVATAGAAIASYKLLNHDEYADVVSVTPVTEEIKTPREECGDEVVTRQTPIKDQNRVAGTVIGAIAGGVIGNELGGHGSNTGAKVAGAAVGGVAGNKIQQNMQENSTYQTTEKVCKTVYDVSEQTVGYNVQYRIGDTTGQVRLDHDPGSRIPVRDGQLVLG
jgi:uncharacterized protein YcfJ